MRTVPQPPASPPEDLKHDAQAATPGDHLAGRSPPLALSGAASAQTVTGPYVSLGAGYNFLQDEYTRTDPAISGLPTGKSEDPITGQRGTGTRYRFGDGFDGVGAIGYGLGNGLRIEIEGDYYNNDVDERAGSPSAGSSRGHTERATAPWATCSMIST